MMAIELARLAKSFRFSDRVFAVAGPCDSTLKLLDLGQPDLSYAADSDSRSIRFYLHG